MFWFIQKAALILLVAAALAQGAFKDLSQEFQDKILECRKQFDVTPDMLKDREHFAGDKKCYFKCVVQGIGLMNDKGEYRTESPKYSDAMAKAIDNCIKTISKTDDLCDYAMKIGVCVFKTKAP